eukprot:621654-Pyramimonas_sp.AAC.1
MWMHSWLEKLPCTALSPEGNTFLCRHTALHAPASKITCPCTRHTSSIKSAINRSGLAARGWKEGTKPSEEPGRQGRMCEKDEGRRNG